MSPAYFKRQSIFKTWSKIKEEDMCPSFRSPKAHLSFCNFSSCSQIQGKDNPPSSLTTKAHPSIHRNFSKQAKMQQLRQSAASSLLPLLIWLFMLSGHVEGNEITFIVVNECPFTIWPATAPNTGQPVIADGGFCLPSGEKKCIQAPPTWSGRLWGRTGCDFTSMSNHACQTGDCGGRLACRGSIGKPPATIVEISLQPSNNFYDVSLVDGYNLPVSISANPKHTQANCFIGGCRKNINGCCPPELQVLDGRGTVVACKSACLAFNLDIFCCRNAYGSPEKCKSNVYSKMFKDACPSYFSYAFDTPSPLVSCTSKEYIITFCPSNWGDHNPIQMKEY